MAKKQIVLVSGNLSTLLTITFVAAKLWDRVDWSWLWVFSPLWIPAAVVLAVMAGIGAVALLCFAIVGVMEGVSRTRREIRKERNRG